MEHTEKTKRKMRIINLGESNPMYGRCHTKATKKKISKETKKSMQNEEVKKKIKYWLNKQMSNDTRIKMSNAHKKIWQTENYIKRMKEHHNKPEVKKRFKELMKNVVTPVKDTSIEVKIQNFLKQLSIEYFTHQYMKIDHGYQCDILIPSMNLVIECDGDYWHKYPIGNDIDHVRTKELIKKGFKVLRLWEFEINAMTINEFEGRIKSGANYNKNK